MDDGLECVHPDLKSEFGAIGCLAADVDAVIGQFQFLVELSCKGIGREGDSDASHFYLRLAVPTVGGRDVEPQIFGGRPQVQSDVSPAAGH